VVKDAIEKMQEIAMYLFREDNIEIAVHGNRSQFDAI